MSNFFSALSNFVVHIGNRSTQISAAIQEFESLFGAVAPVVTAAVEVTSPKVGAALAAGVSEAETLANAAAGVTAAAGQTLAPSAAVEPGVIAGTAPPAA